MEQFKVVVLGNKDAGKTSLVLRYIEGTFSSNQESTVGAFYLQKKVEMPDGTVKMQLWDTAGQERFRAMAPLYYRGASCAIICFDITNEDSFTKLMDWVEELKNPESPAPHDLILAVVCNKCDLESQRQVSRLRAEQFAVRVGALFFETSAKENRGIDELFTNITSAVVQSKGYLNRASTAPGHLSGTHTLDARSPQSNGSSCC